jgi:hypothetical protein
MKKTTDDKDAKEKDTKNLNAHGQPRVDDDAIAAMAVEPKPAVPEIKPAERPKLHLAVSGQAEQLYKSRRLGHRDLGALATVVAQMIEDGTIVPTDEGTVELEGVSKKRFTITDPEQFKAICAKHDETRDQTYDEVRQAQRRLEELVNDMTTLEQRWPTVDFSQPKALLKTAQDGYAKLYKAGGRQN